MPQKSSSQQHMDNKKRSTKGLCSAQQEQSVLNDEGTNAKTLLKKNLPMRPTMNCKHRLRSASIYEDYDYCWFANSFYSKIFAV